MKKKIFFLGLIAVLFCAAFIGRKPVKVFMAGDSTMASKKPERFPETGWGQVFGNYFTNEVTIVNLAMNGRSTKSFISENRWQKILDELTEGDYVIIEFGHNDEKVDNPKLGATLEEYETNLTRFVKETRDKKAIPVLMTPVARRIFKDGQWYNSHGEYPGVVRKVANAEKVAFVDMHDKSWKLLEKLGQQESKKLFLIADSAQWTNYPKGIKDNTHFSVEGANEMARLAIEGIKELKLPLAAYIRQ